MTRSTDSPRRPTTAPFWALTGTATIADPLVVGLDAFAMDASVWVLTLLGGVLADRSNRRRVILLFQSIQMLCPTLFVVLLLTGAVRPWMIVGLSLVVGVSRRSDDPPQRQAPVRSTRTSSPSVSITSGS